MNAAFHITTMARRSMNPRPYLRLGSLAVLLAGTSSWGVEHPGVIPQSSDCVSCHSRQISGKSVHSAMATSCTVCHVTRTQGDMTTVTLAMPKEQICFSCHEKSAALKQHVPVAKEACIGCHDSHSSDQRMLLLKAQAAPA